MADINKLGDLFADLGQKLERRKKYVKQEYQAYGLQLAQEMGEWDKRAMYIRLAKNTDRNLLEKARFFVKDQKHVKTPGKLFMWKLKELKNEQKAKQEKSVEGRPPSSH